MASREYRWADEAGHHGMPYPEELEWLGYARVRRHPRFWSSWLMTREAADNGR